MIVCFSLRFPEREEQNSTAICSMRFRVLINNYEVNQQKFKQYIYIYMCAQHAK